MKDSCKKCGYWTLNEKHGKFKCYTNQCPAKQRDDAPKSMYHKDYYSYLPVANALDREADRVIKPIFKKYMDLGYSPREISQVINTAVDMVECEILLDRSSKIVKAKKAGRK